VIKGIYTSASGMIPGTKKQEITANNIANAGTAGFKRDRLFTKELSRAQQNLTPKRTDWEQSMVDQVYTDFASGMFDRTDNSLDMAIDGDGFFRLETEDGAQLLTRAGSFLVDQSGYLAFPGGALVMGEGGPIEVGSGEVTVSESGEVRSNGAIAGRIVPATVPDLTVMEKIGGSSYVLPENAELIPVPRSTIRQGYLETSNVDIVHEMVEMIISFRNFEANSKALQSQDQTLSQLLSRVGGNN